MNLAAACFLLPRFLHVSVQPQPARPKRRTAAAAALARTEQRTLARHAIITLENRPLQLQVLRGFVWITRDGCPADRVLGVGDVFEQQPGEPVLVQALDEVELLIASARASA